MARKLQHEREEADVVQTLLRDTPRTSWPSLATRADLANVGAIERLGREVEARLDREPREALAIAELATAIADALPADAYPPIVVAQVRAHAWKDRAQALRYLARNEEALEFVARADSVLDAFGTLAHDLAIVRFVRAMVLQELNRFEESLRLLTECRVVFHGHADARRLLLCGIAEGMLLHRLKRFREARETYLGLLEVARELHQESVAIIHNNIGYACIELGDFGAAERHLCDAIEILRALDQPLRVAMAELARGRVLVRTGNVERGIAHLRRTQGELKMHGLVEVAGISGLDVVEKYLTLDRAPEAESLARDIIRDFNAAGLNMRAISALGFLQEAIAARTASVATVDRVRDYIRSLRTRPEREFAIA